MHNNPIDFHPLTIPVASINLDPHADSAPVVAVGQEANLAGPNWRVQFIFRLEVRVLVAGDHLRHRKDTNWIKAWTISAFEARAMRVIESGRFLCCIRSLKPIINTPSSSRARLTSLGHAIRPPKNITHAAHLLFLWGRNRCARFLYALPSRKVFLWRDPITFRTNLRVSGPFKCLGLLICVLAVARGRWERAHVSFSALCGDCVSRRLLDGNPLWKPARFGLYGAGRSTVL